MILGVGAALTAAVLFGAGSILQAISARRTQASATSLDFWLLFRLLRQPVFAAALVVNLSGFGFHLLALRSIPLFLAQAGIAASLAVTALLAVAVFHDHLHTIDYVAVAAVCVGLGLLTASAGTTGDTRAGTALDVGLLIGLVTITGLAVLAARSTSVVGTAIIGLLAGWGFAGVSISGRILPALTWSALIGSPATYLLLASGTLAFLLYSVALQRGSVTAISAPMIITQTITPAVLGVALLGDAVRSGWWAVAVAGFAVTAVGAGILVRLEGQRTDPAEAAGPVG